MVNPDRNMQKAIQQGMQAYRNGARRKDNPFRMFSDLKYATWWDVGWLRAEAEATQREGM